MPGPQSSPIVDNISERFNGISIKDGGGGGGGGGSANGNSSKGRGWRSPAAAAAASGTSWSSPLPDSAVRRQSRPPQTPESKPLGGDREESGSLSRDQREAQRFSMVGRKKDFRCVERVKGRLVNVLEGLELHTNVFNSDEQKKIVDYVYELQEMGRNRQLRERTYSEPRKWMRGKGRITMQFGCCYNYATDKNGNPPGIIRDEDVDPIPPLLKSMIKRMVSWHVLPPTCIPNSCIINIYEKDDCIPPHIDHHDFVRPFCTVSFLTECNILFGADLKVLGPGEFAGSTAIPLPVGSVLILNGNGADVAKHCVPAVPAKRISITFRKMDDSKLPYRFALDPELMNLRPLTLNLSPVQRIVTPVSVSPLQHESQPHTPLQVREARREPASGSSSSGDRSSDRKKQSEVSGIKSLSADDFPPLGSCSMNKPLRKPGRSLRQ